MKNKLYKSVLFIFILSAFSCSNNADKDEFESDEETSLSTTESKIDAQQIFNTLPDRKLVLGLIEENQLQYNPDYLNDPTIKNKYTVEFFKAINLGIYGTDLSIASAFDQSQESMIFLKCVNSLAGQLGVNSAFDQTLFDRIETNKNNKDSVLQLVSGAFKQVDEILKTSHRSGTSATILSGCWIEGLYVSCIMANEARSTSVIKAIVKQKISLNSLIDVLEKIQLAENTKFVLDDLKSLCDDFTIAETATEYNTQTIENISKKIIALRTKIVNADSLSMTTG